MDLITLFIPNAAGKLIPDNSSTNENELMSDDKKILLRKHKITLKQSMDPVDVINHLDAAGIMTPTEVADIKAVASGENIGKIVEKLLDILMRKTNHAFTVLVKALEKTGQKHLAKLLRGS